jgi:phasin
MPTPRKNPKAAARAAEPIPTEVMSVLSAPIAEIESPVLQEPLQETLQETLEASIEKVADFREQIRHVTDETTASIEASLKLVSQGVTDLNVKTLEAFQASADAQFAFVKALLSTKSMSDVITLQNEHLRQQFETLNAAAKDVSDLIQKVSTQSVEPIKATLAKSLKLAA